MSLPLKLTVLASLYLAQGLPYGFFTQALPVILREQGASLKAISATGLLYLPWLLKFLIAPYVDRSASRKGWIVPLQVTATLLAALMAAIVPASDGLKLVLVGVLFFNLLAAIQDVATDGLAVQMLDSRQRGWGNGIQVGAYRIGMILGGGWLLAVFAQSGWTGSFSGMALLLGLAALPILALREPVKTTTTGSGSATRWRGRISSPGVLGFIGLVCVYKFGDSMAASQVGPLLYDKGFSKTEIAWIKGTLGSGVSLLGAALGGWFAARWGRRQALLVCGLLQTLSLVLYALAALGLTGREGFVLACTAEHLLGSMATVALFTVMMDATDRTHASTDYSLFACASVLAMGIAGFTGGVIGDTWGYAPLFASAVVLSALGTVAMILSLDRGQGPAPLYATWATGPLRA